MKAGWWDAPLALQDLAKAIPIINGNRLLLLTKNNFQILPLLSVPHPFTGLPLPFIKTPNYLELESKYMLHIGKHLSLSSVSVSIG